PVVCKPRHGAGSQATFFARSAEEWAACATQARSETGADEAVWQPFVPGLAASVALLLGPVQGVPLLPARQHLSADGRFHYQGGSLPLPPGLARRATELAR